ncbi:MAG: hypothetical protein NUK62_08085 [Tenericutes bacterium]|nr:hypothetical protein [Mycoplasmatota bacterium]
MFSSMNHSGLFEKHTFVIRYNRQWLNNADTDKIVKGVSHETFHSVQYSFVTGSGKVLKTIISQMMN